MTKHTRHLFKLSREMADAVVEHTKPLAVMVTGSVAEGLCDEFSDIDMIVYYDELPDETAITAALAELGAGPVSPLGGSREEGNYAETFDLRGVNCQLGYATVEAWERDIDSVLVGLDVASPLQKAFSGTLEGIPLHGEPFIRKWKERLAEYPDALAREMVTRHLSFFPLWGLQGRLGPRDASIWRFQALVEAAFNLLAVLAGLNRLYFTSFQFKRMRSFVEKMRVAPPDLANRIDHLFTAESAEAAAELERLVQETMELVEQQMPDVDTSRARKRLGWRQPAWHPDAL
jgi:hypothetical protein